MANDNPLLNNIDPSPKFDIQYGVQPVPFHTHNRSDSPPISPNNVVGNLQTQSSPVNVGKSPAPMAGEVLTATSPTTAVWKAPAKSTSTPGGTVTNYYSWDFTGAFSSVDLNNIAWSAGNLLLQDGTSYAISSGATSVTTPGSINPIFTDNFDTYTPGNLIGQGSWANTDSDTSSNTYTVQNSIKEQGPYGLQVLNNISTGTGNISKTGTARTDSTMVFYFYMTSSDQATFGISESGSGPAIYGVFNSGPAGKVEFYAGGVFANLGTFSLNTWHYITIQWRSSDHKASYSVDGGTATPFTTPLRSWSTGLDTVTIIGQGTATTSTYFDNFGPLSIVQPSTFIWFDANISTTAFQTGATYTPASKRILIAVTAPNQSGSGYQTFGGNGGLLIPSSQTIGATGVFVDKNSNNITVVNGLIQALS